MYIKLLELCTKRGEGGRPLSLKAVSEGTGIDLRTIEKFSGQNAQLYRSEYIDAICAFFECTPNDAIGIEPIGLPLKLDLRPPDRRGRRGL